MFWRSTQWFMLERQREDLSIIVLYAKTGCQLIAKLLVVEASLCQKYFTQHVLELTLSGNKPVSRLRHSNAG